MGTTKASCCATAVFDVQCCPLRRTPPPHRAVEDLAAKLAAAPLRRDLTKERATAVPPSLALPPLPEPSQASAADSVESTPTGKRCERLQGGGRAGSRGQVCVVGAGRAGLVCGPAG